VLRSAYDAAYGTGGMLSIAEDYIDETMNPAADMLLHEQETNDETCSFSTARFTVIDL
jgi:type I restriction-modification system DNA methylase subunit